MKRFAAAYALLCGFIAQAQTTAEFVSPALNARLQNADVTAWQIRRYVVGKVPTIAVPESAAEWTAEAAGLRRRVLETAFHGWPGEWIDSPPVFRDLGIIREREGYRLRKLRYEIVPGFEAPALLYEPAAHTGKLPAILDVNGHEAEGKSMEYIQKRCINQARQGILALNLEWIGMGELAEPGNTHWNNAYLDFAGLNALGLYYLAMRRGLDYLWERPDVDHARLGITGLSGGGWQSIVLGALDTRILAAVSVAGYRPVLSVGGAEMIGDNEQSATDLNRDFDYIHLTALRAPRPTLLIYNENDNCCFRASRMKPFLYDAVMPFFKLYSAQNNFHWYENTDPGDHNYQLDNRVHSYAFYERYFHLPAKGETPAGPDLLSAEELTVGVPEANLTILSLARRFAAQIEHEVVPAEAAGRSAWASRQRELLKSTLRYAPLQVDAAWPVANTWGSGLKTIGYRFDFHDGLSASGVVLESGAASDHAPWSIVLNDNGKKASGAAVSARVNRGEQVLAGDLLFIGDAAPPPYYYPVYDRMLATEGVRSLAIEAGQLLGMASWLKARSRNSTGRLEATGIRNQTVALVAAALEPGLFREVQIHGGMSSWREVFAKPVRYQDAPELFCLDLYRRFDLDTLKALSLSVPSSK